MACAEVVGILCLFIEGHGKLHLKVRDSTPVEGTDARTGNVLLKKELTVYYITYIKSHITNIEKKRKIKKKEKNNNDDL